MGQKSSLKAELCRQRPHSFQLLGNVTKPAPLFVIGLFRVRENGGTRAFPFGPIVGKPQSRWHSTCYVKFP